MDHNQPQSRPDSPRALGPRLVDPLEAAERQRSLLLRVVRVCFIVLFATVTLLYILAQDQPLGTVATPYWPLTLTISAGVAAVVLVVDLLTPNKKVVTLFSVLFGLLGAILATVAIGFIIDLVIESWMADAKAVAALKPLTTFIKVLVGITLGYLFVTTILQTRDDFRLVIPYVEFVKQVRGARPMLLDSSALIDSRFAELAPMNLVQAPVLVPRFIVNELQALSDSGEALRRAKGRRGLETIARLQRIAGVDLSIDESPPAPGRSVDQALVDLAERLSGVVVTTDIALSRLAGFQGVPVLNLNELAAALRHQTMPGEEISVRLVRAGEQPGQGVGYLPDGTMVVAENGEDAIGTLATLVVTSLLQTSAGRLIFARIPHPPEPGSERSGEVDPTHADPAHDQELPAPPAEPTSAPPADGSPARASVPRPPRTFRRGTPRNPRR